MFRLPRGLSVASAALALTLLATLALAQVASAKVRSRAPRASGGVVVAAGATSPQGSPVPSNWLAAFNYYRNMAGLPDVTENTTAEDPPGFTWGEGGVLHSKYMVFEGITHEEDPGSPRYTEAGDLAGRKGNVMTSQRLDVTSAEAIESWITAPFHAIGMLDAKLAETGYGQFRKARGVGKNQFGATVDVLRGRTATPNPSIFPIMFPGDGAEVFLDRYPGGEMPDPLAVPDCSAYDPPTGLPIYLMTATEEEYVSSTFTRGTNDPADLAHCAYDDDGYSGSEPGHGGMDPREAIFLIPKRPLASEKTFNVSITTNQNTYSWSFETGDVKPPSSKVVKPAHAKQYDQDALDKVNGTASSESERVDVAIAGLKNVGDWTCKYLKADGTFSALRSCFDQLWLKANGTADWSRKFGTKLPPAGTGGTFKQYMAFSRATDEVGNVERDPDLPPGDANVFFITP